MPAIEKWIFVTGAPRSGTTFVGRILSAPLSVDYIHEPFNPDCGMPGFETRFLYLRPASSAAHRYAPLFDRLFRYDFRLRTGLYPNDSVLRRTIKRVVGSRGPFYLRIAKWNPFHRAAVIKDPIGCLLTEYLASEYGVRPLVMVRHPVAFVASALRLGWRLEPARLAKQPELVRDHFDHEPDFLAREWGDPVESAAALWRALNKVLLAQARTHPEWTVVTHERLSRAPQEEFRRLFSEFDLRWTNRMARLVERRTGGSRVEAASGRVQDFRRDSARIFELRRDMLSPPQRRRVLDITGDVALALYPEESFAPGGEA